MKSCEGERDEGRGCGEVNRVEKEGMFCGEHSIVKGEGVQGSEKSGEGSGWWTSGTVMRWRRKGVV